MNLSKSTLLKNTFDIFSKILKQEVSTKTTF